MRVFRFDGSLIHFVAHYGWPADVLEAVQRDFPIRPGCHSTTARAILTREVAHIPDAAADPEYALPAVLQTGVHTMLSVPILQDGNPVGAITVTRREIEPFSQAQIDLLKTFADQAVIAIENVRLFNETREGPWSNKPRPPRYCRSSIPRLATSRRCSMSSWKRPMRYAAQLRAV